MSNIKEAARRVFDEYVFGVGKEKQSAILQAVEESVKVGVELARAVVVKEDPTLTICQNILKKIDNLSEESGIDVKPLCWVTFDSHTGNCSAKLSLGGEYVIQKEGDKFSLYLPGQDHNFTLHLSLQDAKDAAQTHITGFIRGFATVRGKADG